MHSRELNDNALFAELQLAAKALPPYVKPAGPSKNDVAKLAKRVREAMVGTTTSAGNTAPDLSIPGHKLPHRTRYAKLSLYLGHISEELIVRLESGEYPTLEDHLAGITPVSRPYLNLADEISRRSV